MPTGRDGKRKTPFPIVPAGGWQFCVWERVAESTKNDFGFVRLQFVTFSKDIWLDVFLAAEIVLFFPAYL